MWRITNPLSNLGRLLRELGRRAGAITGNVARIAEQVGRRYWLEVVAAAWLLVVLAYGAFGPSDVRLCRVGDTVVTAPAWVVALIVSLVFAVVFALVVSQIEDE